MLHLDKRSLAFGAASKRKDLLHDCRTALGACFESFENVHRHSRRFLEHPNGYENGSERVVEVMRDSAGKSANTLHPLGAQKMRLEFFLFRDVAVDDEERFGPPLCVAHQTPPAF